jgi:hypothetical protein
MFVALMYAFHLPREYQRSLTARLNSIQANSLYIFQKEIVTNNTTLVHTARTSR